MSICTLRKPHPKNPRRCKYYRDGGTCIVPGYYRCINWLARNQDLTSIEELLSHPDFTRIDRPIEVKSRTGEVVIVKEGKCAEFLAELHKHLTWTYSFSQLYSCYGVCRRKWYIRYVKRVVPIDQATPLVLGSAGHDVLAELHGGKPWKFARRKFDNYQQGNGDETLSLRMVGVKALCRAYNRMVDIRPLATERKATHVCLPLVGYFDGMENADTETNDAIVFEHKFVSSISELSEYWLAQASFYFFLDPCVKHIVLNLLRKPDLRMCRPKKGQTETVDEAYNRIYRQVCEHWEDYHRTIVIERPSTFRMNRTNDEILQLVSELELARGNRFLVGYFPRNPYACKSWGRACEYLPLCQTGQCDLSRYTIECRPSGRYGVDKVGEDE